MLLSFERIRNATPFRPSTTDLPWWDFRRLRPPVPFVRNYIRNERLYERLGSYLADFIRTERIDLVHAQHLLTGPSSVIAARRAGIPVVCTIRDYWPVCYWGDVLAEPRQRCAVSRLFRFGDDAVLRPRTGAAWPVALPAIPYMRSNLRNKQASLANADVIVAVSSHVGTGTPRAAPQLARARIEAIPNGVDAIGVLVDANATTRPLSEPYAVFAGKLATNKGAHMLVDVASLARLSMPLIVIGDGPERGQIERAAAAAGRDVR
jgi:glycosyltransferase involved in cell wall biosynthesis